MSPSEITFLPVFHQPLKSNQSWKEKLLQACRSTPKSLVLALTGIGALFIIVLLIALVRKPPLVLPSPYFTDISAQWKDIYHLIILPGHAIQWCNDIGKSVDDESCWYLQSFQQGQVPLFLAHVKRAIEEAAHDPKSLLVFSGGQTRPGVGIRTEAYSYFSAAEQLGYFHNYRESHVFERSVSEDFARDSLENVMFSICRFRQVVGHYPRKITVVGFPFKAQRFLDLHRKAVNFPQENFKYIGVEVKGYDQSKIVDDAYEDFNDDLYGCSKKLMEKRASRNPFKNFHGYKGSCPDMVHYFDTCEGK